MNTTPNSTENKNAQTVFEDAQANKKQTIEKSTPVNEKTVTEENKDSVPENSTSQIRPPRQGNWQNNQYYSSQYYAPNTFKPAYTGKTFVPQPSGSKAIPIINPNTSQVINVSSSVKKEDIKTPATTSRPIKITNPKDTEEVKPKVEEKTKEPSKEEAEKETPKEEEKPKEEAKAVEETTPSEEEKPKEEVEPTEESKPVEETKPAEEDSKAEKETSTKEEERIAAITAEKMARGVPGRLDISAIPAHVFHESPVTTPTSPLPPKVKGPPMRVIEDFSAIEYPPEFLAPTIRNTTSGRITYEPAFLLQFQNLCKETDEDLSEFKDMMQASPNTGDNKRSGSRRQGSERGRGPRTPGGSGEFSRSNSRDNRSEMGKFSGGRQISHRQGSNGPNSPMERQGSKNRSGRGKGRNAAKGQSGGPTIPLDQVVPLEKSENRWVPAVVATDGTASTASEVTTEAELISQEIITRKVKSLLNKLTLEKFDSISGQIWDYAKQSEKEKDGQSLRTVIELVFDKAIDEPNFSSMWAQLCKKMSELITTGEPIIDENAVDKEGKPVSGVLLYRRYLLNRCQKEFLKGWKTDLPKLEESASGDVMLTDEYYAAVKAKRQGLGLVQFIGELFKLQMLTDRIMIDCMIRLCSDPQHPEDEETETMCRLLTTIGRSFEFSSKKNKEWFDVYFERMNEMYKSDTLSSRVKFMILDVFDLRKNKWVPKRGAQQAGPATIAEIHEQAKKASEEKEKETMKRSGSSRGGGNPMSRQNSRAGHNISRQNSSTSNKSDKEKENVSADGWTSVGTTPTSPARSGRTNELANFGKTRSKARNSVLGPSSTPFSSLSRSSSKSGLDKKAASTEKAPAAATSMSNMFSALGGEEDHEEPAERKKLELLPRSTEVSEEPEAMEEEAPAADDDKPKLSDEVIERRSKNTIEEYFSLRDKTELRECVKELDHTHYRVIFARKLLDVVEKKAEDVEVVCDMIAEIQKENLISREEFVEAFKLFWEIYEDLVIDVPKAPEFVDKLLKAAGIERSEVECEPAY